MKDKLNLVWKGAVLGLSFILPGISGGVLAVVMGVYDKLIEAVSHFYESWDKFKKYFVFLLFLGIGAVLSILLLTNAIEIALNKIPIITILLFVGLISGGVPTLLNKVKGNINVKNIVFMFCGMALLLVMAFTTANGTNQVINTTPVSMIKMFGIGILSSATIVVPGVSGSFLLMVMGYYEPILKIVNELTQFSNLTNNIIVMIPLGIGLVIGVVLISKIIDKCLQKYNTETYSVIIGFVIASIVEVFVSVFSYEFVLIQFIIGLVLMFIGALVVRRFFEK